MLQLQKECSQLWYIWSHTIYRTVDTLPLLYPVLTWRALHANVTLYDHNECIHQGGQCVLSMHDTTQQLETRDPLPVHSPRSPMLDTFGHVQMGQRSVGDCENIHESRWRRVDGRRRRHHRVGAAGPQLPVVLWLHLESAVVWGGKWRFVCVLKCHVHSCNATHLSVCYCLDFWHVKQLV